MATVAEVKEGLDQIAQTIAKAQARRDRGKADLIAARTMLADLPALYADVIATINAYSPVGAFETLAKDERSKLQAEFLALKAALETELTAIGVEF